MFLVSAIVLSSACKPDFGTPQSLVVDRRVLAVKGEPAEVRPGNDVTFTPLIVSPGGTDTTSAIDWALCLTPKPLDENNIVADACLGGGSAVMPVGTGMIDTATVPLDACQRFGPDPPPVMPGQPPLRPRDPDVSGGYYQPMRATADTVVGFGLERITCNLASAGADVAIAYGMEYQANHNPSLLPLTADADLGAIKPGQAVTLTAAWTPESVETYPVYDLTSQMLVDHRESMRVSWFVTAGSFEHERTGRDETETETATDDVWTAPTQPGVVHLWIVLRDARGGLDFAAYDLTVTP
jgi:hypothetical protein